MDLLFLQNPDVWTAATAVLALVISLWPKIASQISTPGVSINLPNNFQLTHYLGKPNLNIFLDINNTSSRSVTIARIDCVLVKHDGPSRKGMGRAWHTPAQTIYLKHPPIQAGQSWPELMIGGVSLKAGEHWQETVRCFSLFTQEEEEKTQIIRVEMSKNISQKINERISQGLPPMLLAADEAVVNKACAFFERTFDLSKGEYRMYVAALSDSGIELGLRGYKFILFENAIQALHDIVEDYKYGWGIVYPHPGTTVIPVQPRLERLEDEEQIRRDYKIVRLLP